MGGGFLCRNANGKERKIACTVLGGPPKSALGTSLVATNYSLFRPFEKKEIGARSFFSAAESPSSFARTFVWRLGSLLPMRAVCRTST